MVGMVGSKVIVKSVLTDVCYFLFCRLLTTFIYDLFQLYTDLYFTYLEINPLGKDSCFVFIYKGYSDLSYCNQSLSKLGFPVWILTSL